MNHVFSVTCVRSAQSLRASSQQPLLSAICLVRSRWYATTTTNNDDGAGSSSLTRAATTVRECKHPLIQGLKQTSVERQSLTSLAHNSPKSCFHSSAIYSKAKKSAKQPPKQPFQRWNVPGSSQLLSKTERPSSPQESVYKSRYRRQLPPYSGSLDLNPSGKPISYKSQEWTDCVENTTLDPLSKDEAGKIFGTVLDVDAAQEILQVLQYQRLSGTLDHAIAVPELPDILVANALEFLRERYPFDEDAAIMARIEREYDAEESEVADDDGKPAYVPQQDAEKTGIYGNSMIDENKAKLEQQEAEKAEKREEKGHEVGPPAKRLTFRERALAARQQESAEWVRKYKEKALLSDGPPPDMSVQQRLLPSAIFALITAACCLALATSYVSPPRAARLFPDTPPAAATVLTLIAINVAIFVAWGFPFAWRFMNTHFILVAGAPRTSSLLGNIFSHHGFTHLLSNVLGLWFIGTWLHDDIGRGNFLATYISGGVLTSFIALSSYVLRGKLNISTLGASGTIFTMIAARCILHSGEDFRLAFLPADTEVALPANWLYGFIVALEVLALIRNPHAIDQTIDRISHLAGLTVGTIIGLLLRAKLRSQDSQDAATEPNVQSLESPGIGKDSERTYNVTVSKPAAVLPSK